MMSKAGRPSATPAVLDETSKRIIEQLPIVHNPDSA